MLVFAGVYILPEYRTSENVIFRKIVGSENGENYGYIHSGLQNDYKDKGYYSKFGPSRHLTIVFNTFVWL